MVGRRKRPDGTEFPGWYARWTDAHGKRRLAKAGRTKTAAELFLRKRLDERDHVRATGQRPTQRVTFEKFLPELERHWRATLAPATLAGRIGFIRKSSAHFGSTPLLHISLGDVQAWLTKIRTDENLQPSTLRTWATVLSAAFRLAVDLGYARANPAHGVKLPKVDEKPIRRMTTAEVEKLYGAIPEDFRPCVVFIGETGVRRNEALELTWGDVEDFRRVTVRRSKSHRPRTVTLTPRAAETLRAVAAPLPTPLDPTGRVFTISSARLNHRFRIAADSVGLTDITPHTLRHAVGTQLAEAGVPTRDIRDVMGHKSATTTERYMNRAPQTAVDVAYAKLAQARGQTPTA